MSENLEAYFDLCDKNRELLADIQVVVPVRPHDGITPDLVKRLAVWYGEGTSFSLLEDSMGGFIEVMRARIAKEFLEGFRQKFVLMIDSDMSPPLELPYLLARHDKPVVGSCACSFNRDGELMLCLTREDINGDPRFPVAESGAKIPMTGLAEVPHVGTGAMMIRRDVLEAFSWEGDDIPFFMPAKYRENGMREGKIMRGEDLVFCDQARKKGFQVYVDMEAHCGHRKEMKLAWHPEQRDPSLRVEEWRLPAHGMMVAKDV